MNNERVFVTRAGTYDDPVAGGSGSAAFAGVTRLLRDAGLDAANAGTPAWNPLGTWIAPGAKVVLKPNWVFHENRSGTGLDCLVTHPTVTLAVLEYVVRAHPGTIVVGDAPIQACEFETLMRWYEIEHGVARARARVERVDVRDFRGRVLVGDHFGGERYARPDASRIEVDLGADSALEPVAHRSSTFRVTMYDPQLMRHHHRPAVHRYLIARDILEADVVISLPKLKTHKKAGFTGAMKNLVGINVLKDCLPHHRVGPPRRGGDCYARASRWKGAAEWLLDRANATRSRRGRSALGTVGRACRRLGALATGDPNLEGSWHGNDTIWRTVIDLNRIASFADRAGRMRTTRQRHVLSLTDAMVAGEGEGPLAPTPVPLGLLTLSTDAVAADCVHALLLGFDPQRIPTTREAQHRRAASGAPPVCVHWDGREMSLDDLRRTVTFAVKPPSGWQGRCECASAVLAGVHA